MMPGLTLNTQAATAGAQPQTIPAPAPAASSGTSATVAPSSNTTNQGPDPIQTPNNQNQPTSRSSSPTRPPYSPITPPLKPTALPPRPTYTHSSHADAAAIPAPPKPEPIDFDSNPDVLALKSAISILQMQRRKAETDMATLGRVKSAALAEPDAFVRDLTTGRVGVEGDRLFIGGVRKESSDSESESDEDGDAEMGEVKEQANEDEDEKEKGPAAPAHDGNIPPSADTEKETTSAAVAAPDSLPQTAHLPQPQPQTSSQPSAAPEPKPEPDAMDMNDHKPKAWTTLPKPQNIVRCPPINWSQYAVVGESLDRLHNEQLSRPAQGTPAVMTSDGRIEFKGGGPGKQEKLVGIAAPYTPGKDRLDKKAKGVRR